MYCLSSRKKALLPNQKSFSIEVAIISSSLTWPIFSFKQATKLCLILALIEGEKHQGTQLTYESPSSEHMGEERKGTKSFRKQKSGPALKAGLTHCLYMYLHTAFRQFQSFLEGQIWMSWVCWHRHVSLAVFWQFRYRLGWAQLQKRHPLMPGIGV